MARKIKENSPKTRRVFLQNALGTLASLVKDDDRPNVALGNGVFVRRLA